MKANVGSADKVVRLILGVALLSLLFVAEGGLRYLGLIGLIPLATALMSWCPLYSLFGLSTCPVKPAARKQ